MDMAKWKDCELKELPIELYGQPVYVGFDMSAKTDLTSVTFMIPYLSGEYDGNGKEIVKYYFWTHSFIPTREKLHEHIVKDKVPYDAWERQGFLEVTDTPIVDQGRVMRYGVTISGTSKPIPSVSNSRESVHGITPYIHTGIRDGTARQYKDRLQTYGTVKDEPVIMELQQ